MVVERFAVDDIDQLQIQAHLDGRHEHHLAFKEVTHAMGHLNPDGTVDTDEYTVTVDNQ